MDSSPKSGPREIIVNDVMDGGSCLAGRYPFAKDIKLVAMYSLRSLMEATVFGSLRDVRQTSPKAKMFSLRPWTNDEPFTGFSGDICIKSLT